MRSLGTLLCALMVAWPFAATSVRALQVAGFGTRVEAIAMVQRVRDGAEVTLRAINNAAPGFLDRDLFADVHRIDGIELVAIPVTPVPCGKNLHDMKDQDGRFSTEELTIGHGSDVDGCQSPASQEIEQRRDPVESSLFHLCSRRSRDCHFEGYGQITVV